MTQPLSAESPRRAAARAFGVGLRKAIVRRRIAKRELARRSGVTRSAIANYCCGSNLPTQTTAARLAEVLDASALLEIMARARELVCPIDGVRFVFAGQSRRTYCSPECQHVADKMRQGVDHRVTSEAAVRRLKLHQQAIGAMCRSCQPDGECRDATCPLRVVSPLPLAQSVFAAAVNA